jgi:heavy metal efflux system protein
VGEIYRYQLTGPGYSLNELKATQDWLVVREIKQVPGIIDVATFGGTTRQYQAEVDPNKLLTYGITMTQVVNAVTNSNANAGGNYLTIGSQSVNVRGIGLLHSLDDMRNIVVAERNGVPVLLRDVSDVREGHQPRLGKVGRSDFNHHDDPDIVQAIVLLQKGAKSLPALAALREKIDRSTTAICCRRACTSARSTTARRSSTSPLPPCATSWSWGSPWSLWFCSACWATGASPSSPPSPFLSRSCSPSASWCSPTSRRTSFPSAPSTSVFSSTRPSWCWKASTAKSRAASRAKKFSTLSWPGVADAATPVLFATLIILVAFIPLFTMQGVPGKIFAPMSVTYGFALTGALIFALIFAPALASLAVPKNVTQATLKRPGSAAFFRRHYDRGLNRALRFRGD